MPTRPDWFRIDPTAPTAVADLCADLERSALAERVTIFNDPRWIASLANQADKTARIYALREQGTLAGLAAFLVHPSSLPLAMGELTLFSRPVRRLNAFAPPLALGGGDRAQEASSLAALLRRLRRDLAHDEVLFLESVAEGTALYDLVGGRESRVEGFHVLRNGNLYRHRFARIPDSFDRYLGQLGSSTRADLRKNRKRFIAHTQGHYRTRCFRSPAEVPAFVADAMKVSSKTYQYRLLGSGLRAREALEDGYRATAGLGWFRSYILYVNETPVAFQVGDVYRRCFHAQVIGYDPDWAQHHVGIFLHSEIIIDLAASGGAVTEFDFGNGDGPHKERLSTGSRLEGYFYLIPSHFKGSAMAHSMRATHAASAALGAVLGKVGLRKKTRDLLRRLGAMK